MSDRYNKNESIQSKLCNIFTTSSKANKLSILHDVIIYGVIIINSLLVAINSFRAISNDIFFQDSFKTITIVSILILAINYLVRLWSCTSSKETDRLSTMFKYIFSPMAILEFFVIITVIIFGADANLIFLLLMKIFQVSEYIGTGDNYSPAQILKRSFINKKEELLITILLSVGLLLLSSFIIFKFEAPVQPDKFDNIIPSISWVFSILTNNSVVDFHPITAMGKIFQMVMVLLGVLIVGLPIGIITGSFIEEIQESKKNEILKKRSDILINAFKQEQKITVRTLVKELDLPSERKALDVDFAMARLEYSEGEIFEASRYSKSLRTRACKQTIESTYEDNLVLESFPVNTTFGSFIDRDSNIHVISTQSVGDMSIGHFSRIVAGALNANYYSNEFFSSAELFEERQINFASNKFYNSSSQEDIPKALQDWIETLNTNIKPKDLVIYLGTASATRVPYYHVLCGGKKGTDELLDIENPTINDIQDIVKFYDTLSESMDKINLPITAHSEFGNTNKNHLTQVLRNNNKANVIGIYVSVKLLQFTSLDIYYKAINSIVMAVNEILKGNQTRSS